MKELNARSYLKIIGVARGVAQEGGPGGSGPLNWNATNDTNMTKKTLFLHFQFLLASLRTTVHAYNSN